MSLKVIFSCKHFSTFTVKSFSIHPSPMTSYLEMDGGESKAENLNGVKEESKRKCYVEESSKSEKLIPTPL